MKNINLFDDFINEKIINTKPHKEYLDKYFKDKQILFNDIINIYGLQYIINDIDISLPTPYTIIVNSSPKFQFETYLKKECSDIIFHINDYILKQKLKNIPKFIKQIKNGILHEFIHIEQYSRGNFLHPIKSNAIKFNKIIKDFENSKISKDEYINGYLDEPYELMAIASTLVYNDVFINGKDKDKIISDLKYGQYEILKGIDKMKKIRIANYMIQYLELY